MMKKSLILVALSVATWQTLASECKPTVIEQTINPMQFVNNKDGTVTDLRFRLQWSICSYGQTYNVTTDSCTGEPTPLNTWEEALASQDAFNSQSPAGKKDWRLPNIKELQTVVERQCRNPAINLAIFKGVANGVYWSNTPDDTNNTSLIGRMIDFSDGTETLKATNTSRFVRHVRDI